MITGPSGVGKGTLIRGLLERLPQLELSVSATTRAPRPGEQSGTPTTSWARTSSIVACRAGEFVEHASYSGSRYGTLRSELEEPGSEGVPVVLEIELQGARQVREAMPEAIQVFIAPPSRDALRARLVGRGTDPASRSSSACVPPSASSRPNRSSPHVVVNDRLEQATEELQRSLATHWGRLQQATANLAVPDEGSQP